MTEFAGDRLLDELARALVSAGLEVEIDNTDGGTAVVSIDHVKLRVRLKEVSQPRPDAAAGLPASGSDVLDVLVADQIGPRTRVALDERGWSWLDRRGRLRLWHPGLRVDVDVPPSANAKRRADQDANPFAPGGLDVIVTLLAEPGTAWSVRELARRVGRDPGHVSRALAALERRALIDRNRRPLIPELFWASVDDWPRHRTWLYGDSDVGGVDSSGWVLSDYGVLAYLGGPALTIVGDTDEAGQEDFYVADQRHLDAIVAKIGVFAHPVAGHPTISVAPCPAVMTLSAPHKQTSTPYRIAHPVVVALDLAGDARGRELLADWQPKDTSRVW